jgi:DNA-binding MarR family transcriptional regulator
MVDDRTSAASSDLLASSPSSMSESDLIVGAPPVTPESDPMGSASVLPAAPDFGILLMLAARAFADDLHARLAAEGFPAMRAGFGFMFRAIQDGEPTPSELAARLGVSKQAVGKVLDEMEQRGFVERRPDQTDRRARRVRLTEHGRAASETAIRLGGQIEAVLASEVGQEQVAALRSALLAYVEAHGGREDAAARRARPTW